jgi:hypothetical protein
VAQLDHTLHERLVNGFVLFQGCDAVGLFSESMILPRMILPGCSCPYVRIHDFIWVCMLTDESLVSPAVFIAAKMRKIRNKPDGLSNKGS